MITSNEKTRRLWWRLLVIMPVLAALLVASPKVTAQKQAADEKSTTMEMNQVQFFDDYGVTQFQDTIFYNNKGSYLKIEPTDAFDPVSSELHEKDSIYNNVEVMPEFPGGMEAMMQYLSENIKYPEKAKDKNTQGTVLVAFVVEKNGKISNVKVIVGVGDGCDEEAVRVISAMPKWKAGMQNGKKVRVNFAIPIKFTLR